MKENLSRIVKDANVNSLRQLALTLEDLYKKDDKGNTLFLQAVFIKPRYKRQPILDEIFRQISALLSPQAADYVGTTLLHWAVMCNQTDATVREIFLKNPDNISFQNYYKQTPLHFAINYRYLNMVKMMVNLTGIEIDRNDLKLAIKLGYKEIVEFLISEKNPHHAQMMNSSKKHAEKTALTYAIQYGRTEIAELLISHDTVLQNKYLLLENAIKDNSIKAVETLIKEVEILPNKKNALLEIAINRGHIQSAECLINKGATLKEVSPFLKQAIDNNQLEVLKLLLREYKSIFNKNCDAAEDINLLEIIEPFVEYALKKGNSQISSKSGIY
jgi:ankyrin repeat protein